MKQWSLDARSKGQPRPLPLREIEGVGRALAWAYGMSRRASGWAGEKVARSWDHPATPYAVIVRSWCSPVVPAVQNSEVLAFADSFLAVF